MIFCFVLYTSCLVYEMLGTTLSTRVPTSGTLVPRPHTVPH